MGMIPKREKRQLKNKKLYIGCGCPAKYRKETLSDGTIRLLFFGTHNHCVQELQLSFIWNLVVQSLRPEARNIKPEVSMSDDDNAAWNGFRRKTFTSLKHKLLCWWHVDQNVQKHCHGSKCKVQVIYYYNHNFRSYNLCSYVHSVCSYQMFI